MMTVRALHTQTTNQLGRHCFVSDQTKKAYLSKRGQLVGLGSSEKDRKKISKAVFNAYNYRNNVVHGDVFDEDKYWRVFPDLKEWMLYLFLAYIDLLTHIAFSKQPKSGKKLRKALREHFEKIDTVLPESFLSKAKSLTRCLKLRCF